MYMHLTPNLLHFLPNLDGLYTLRPTFMKYTPGVDFIKAGRTVLSTTAPKVWYEFHKAIYKSVRVPHSQCSLWGNPKFLQIFRLKNNTLKDNFVTNIFV